MALGGFQIPGKAGLRDTNQSPCARLSGAARMQGIHHLRLEFPAHDCLCRVIAADPCVYKAARRIDLEIFTLDVESPAIGTGAFAPPLAAGTDVHGRFRNAVKAFLSPPAG